MSSSSKHSLDGIKVADFSRVLAGPVATMLLGDLGADVIKIERPGAGDDTRMWGPPYAENGMSTYYMSLNRNKRSVALDLRDPGQMATAREIAEEADIVVENFRPGVMGRLGLDYDDLRDANPGLIYCSVTGFGAAEGAGLGGYDFLVQAMGGLMSITGETDGPPIKVGVPLVDLISGLFATIGILAAIAERERSGEGQRVDVSLLGSLLAAMPNLSANHLLAGITPHRLGNAHPQVVPYELLPTADGEIALAVGNDGQFGRLCEIIGDPGCADLPEYATNAARVVNREALKARLIDGFAGRGTAEWVDLLTAAGIPAGKVNDIPEAFELAARLGLDPVVEIEDAAGERFRQPRNPIGLSRTPPRYESSPPALDEHGAAIRDGERYG